MSFELHGIVEDHPLKSGGWELLRSFSLRSPQLVGFHAELQSKRVAIVDDGLLLVHANYRGDGASVPGFVPRWLIDAEDEKITAAWWVHDALYDLCRSGQIKEWEALRAVADQLFYEIMISRGVPKWRAKGAYLVLRWRGAYAARPQPDVELKVRVAP